MRRIPDFGCGIGHGTERLAEAFPDAEAAGVDAAENALEGARERYGGHRIHFANLSGWAPPGAFNLC